MFDTTGFWKRIFIFIGILAVIYFLVDTFLLKKKSKNLTKSRNILTNILLGLGIFYLFYSIYAIIPEILNPAQFFTQNIINSLLYVCVLALATAGIVLIFKTSTTTNFAQGMVATVGAYTAAKVVIHLTTKYTEMGNTMVVMLAMLFGAIIAFLLGAFIDVAIIRNSKLPTSVGKQMITMGLVLIITGLIPVVFGNISLSMPRMVYGDVINFTLFNNEFRITPNALLAIILTVVVLTILFSALRFTKWGLGVRATASNEVVASMMGVNTRVITAMSWAIAGFLGAIAAVIWAANSATIGVELMLSTQVNGFMASILGSFGSFMGPIITSIFIPVITGLLSLVNNGWENAIVYGIILVIVLVKPLGLFGKQVAKKV